MVEFLVTLYNMEKRELLRDQIFKFFKKEANNLIEEPLKSIIPKPKIIYKEKDNNQKFEILEKYLENLKIKEIEDDENEFLEEEEEKDEIEDNNLREKEQEENGEENEKFNEVLKKFDIQENRNIINNKNYLTKNAILLSRTIEDYRQEEIKEQKRKEQEIKNDSK